jgi:hypothetical protein
MTNPITHAGELSRHDELSMLAVRRQGTMNQLLRLVAEELRENGGPEIERDTDSAGVAPFFDEMAVSEDSRIEKERDN